MISLVLLLSVLLHYTGAIFRDCTHPPQLITVLLPSIAHNNNNVHKQVQTVLTTLLGMVDRKAAKGTSIQSPRKYVYQHDLSDLPQQRKTLISGKQF